MKNEDNKKLVNQYQNIRSILKSLEKDSEQGSKDYENLNRMIRNYYMHNLNYGDKGKAAITASNFINNYKSSLKRIQDIEKRENRLFNTTSNAALLTTIGAAISASLIPTIVGPAAAIAAATALGGYIGKLKLDSDAKDEVKDLIENITKAGLEELSAASLTSQASGTPKSGTPS
ncbi:hypothetical protein [Microbulbifer taiwanensis]|uniref:Glycine zipper family protein n=1 Tax=Microbulbifer taiwanensis TaxID=986746 RepID=A0ABW1YJQ1_9GAMM|nr:hypothetical protein [Microbulbifer taiwanensis]